MQSGICLAYLCPRTRPAVFSHGTTAPSNSDTKNPCHGGPVNSVELIRYSKTHWPICWPVVSSSTDFPFVWDWPFKMCIAVAAEDEESSQQEEGGSTRNLVSDWYWTPLRWMDSLIGTSVSTVQLSTVVTCMHTLLNTQNDNTDLAFTSYRSIHAWLHGSHMSFALYSSIHTCIHTYILWTTRFFYLKVPLPVGALQEAIHSEEKVVLLPICSKVILYHCLLYLFRPSYQLRPDVRTVLTHLLACWCNGHFGSLVYWKRIFNSLPCKTRSWNYDAVFGSLLEPTRQKIMIISEGRRWGSAVSSIQFSLHWLKQRNVISTLMFVSGHDCRCDMDSLDKVVSLMVVCWESSYLSWFISN
jgi:hypothetical protein